MRSAFGIEHTTPMLITKSLSGGVFKPASKLSGAERKAVGGYRKAKGVSAGDKEFAENHQYVKDFHDQPRHPWGMKHTKTEHGKQGTTKHYEHSIISNQVPPGAGGFHIRTGGKKGTSYIHMRDDADKSVTAHEVAHASPKRTSYRMHQVARDPKKTMAEEARADYVSRGHYLKGEPDGGYAQAAKIRNAEARGEKSQEKAKKWGGPPARSLVRLQGTMDRAKSKHVSAQLSRVMNKPVGRKEIDEYRRVQDRMHGGAPKTPGMSPGVKTAIGTGAVGAAGAGGGSAMAYDFSQAKKRKRTNG